MGQPKSKHKDSQKEKVLRSSQENSSEEKTVSLEEETIHGTGCINKERSLGSDDGSSKERRKSNTKRKLNLM